VMKVTKRSYPSSISLRPQGYTDGNSVAHIFEEHGFPDAQHPYLFLGGYIGKGLRWRWGEGRPRRYWVGRGGGIMRLVFRFRQTLG